MPTHSWIEVPIDQEVWGVPESGYAPHFFPPEGDYLLFHFTEESFLRVLSALINGAALTYPDTWLQVVWDFLKNVEYPVSLCDQIAACIAENEETRQAIRDLVTTDTVINQYITEIAMQEALSLLERERNLLKPEACDPDFIFNQTSVLVQLLHDLTEDLFEALEVGTNALERGTILLGGIPIFGQIVPADELLALADQFVEEISEEYIGAYDEALYDSIRCDLFCLVKDDCTLSIDRAITYYEGKLAEEFPSDPWQALQAIVAYLSTGDLPTDTSVYAMHLLVLALIRQSSNVFGVDFGILALRVTAAGDDGNNDWEALCLDCVEPPPGDCYDFVGSEDGWTEFVNSFGVHYAQHDALGWKPDFNAGIIAILKTIPGEIAAVTIKLAEPLEDTLGGAVTMYVLTEAGSVAATNSTAGLTEYEFTGLSLTAGLQVNASATNAHPSTQRIVEVCVVLVE